MRVALVRGGQVVEFREASEVGPAHKVDVDGGRILRAVVEDDRPQVNELLKAVERRVVVTPEQVQIKYEVVDRPKSEVDRAVNDVARGRVEAVASVDEQIRMYERAIVLLAARTEGRDLSVSEADELSNIMSFLEWKEAIRVRVNELLRGTVVESDLRDDAWPIRR